MPAPAIAAPPEPCAIENTRAPCVQTGIWLLGALQSSDFHFAHGRGRLFIADGVEPIFDRRDGAPEFFYDD
jgi:hypothetical protein